MVIAAIASFIGDIYANPLIAYLFFLLSLIMGLSTLLLCLSRRIKVAASRRLPLAFRNFVSISNSIFVLILAAFAFFASAATEETKADGGVMASQFEAIARIQGSLGIIEREVAAIRTEIERQDADDLYRELISFGTEIISPNSSSTSYEFIFTIMSYFSRVTINDFYFKYYNSDGRLNENFYVAKDSIPIEPMHMSYGTIDTHDIFINPFDDDIENNTIKICVAFREQSREIYILDIYTYEILRYDRPDGSLNRIRTSLSPHRERSISDQPFHCEI